MKEINIGILVNTHGLRGEVKVKCLSDFPEIRFRIGNTIYLKYQKKEIALTIQNVREAKGLFIVKFKDYDDINLVEIWKGSNLYIHEEDLHELQDDEAYYFELMDSEVIDLEGHTIGCVSEVIETGANVVLRVKGAQKEVLIPYVNAFIHDFDKKQKKITVSLLEGM